MSKPWREGLDIVDGAYDISPGPSWGTIIIDGVTETIDELTYWKSAHQKKIRIIDGLFSVSMIHAKYYWIGDVFPGRVVGRWTIDAVVKINR